MDTHLIQETALKTLAGSISFPEAVGNLLRAAPLNDPPELARRQRAALAGSGF